MHIIKRVSLLGVISLAALGSQAAAPEQPTATARKSQVNAPAMDADAERRARELLEKALSGTAAGAATGSTSAPASVATAPAQVQGQQPVQQKPLREPREVVSGQPERAPSPSAADLDLQREREIRRIEAEVEAARKRREAATASIQPAQPARPVAQTPVRPSPSAAPPSSPSTVTPVTDPRGLAVLQSQATPVPIGQPHAPASPAAPTLTPEAEEKARELLRRNMMIIFNDYPTPQRTTPGTAVLPGTQPSAPISPNAALPEPTIRAEVPAPPPAAAPLGASTLTTSDEQRARDLLHQIPTPGQTALPAAPPPVTVAPPSRNTGVQPPPPATLELPNAGAASVRPVAPIEAPKAQVVAPPATAVVPPTELPRPAAPPAQQVITVPPVATPPPVAVAPPGTLTPVTPPPSAYVPPAAPTAVPPAQGIGVGGLTTESETKARQLVTQQVAEFRRSENIVPAAPAATASPVVVPGAPGSPEEVKATRELIKQQEREGKRRRAEEKRLEAEAKKQADRLDREGTAKAREEARRRLEAEAKARASGKTVSKPTSGTTSGTPFKLTPGTKRQRLDQLTDAYVHDRIGAEEYHRERAKIVGEPGE